MKSYTNLEQSKKLAEILPIESADMLFQLGEDKYADSIRVPLTKEHWEQMMPDINPCWSLAALVAILPASCDDGQHCFALINCNPNGDTEWLCCYEDCKGNLLYECYDNNPIDACVELILKLHEQKLL